MLSHRGRYHSNCSGWPGNSSSNMSGASPQIASRRRASSKARMDRDAEITTTCVARTDSGRGHPRLHPSVLRSRVHNANAWNGADGSVAQTRCSSRRCRRTGDPRAGGSARQPGAGRVLPGAAHRTRSARRAENHQGVHSASRAHGALQPAPVARREVGRRNRSKAQDASRRQEGPPIRRRSRPKQDLETCGRPRRFCGAPTCRRQVVVTR